MIIFFIISYFLTFSVLADVHLLEKVDVQGTSIIDDIYNPSSTADLLKNISHITNRKNGGIADTPSINGFSSDRVNIQVDGAILTNSCPNHMNPTLSFVHPDQVENIISFAGLDSLANGGDNIGGSILVKTKKAQFTEKGFVSKLDLRSFYKSNNFNSGVALNTYVSSPRYYFSYQGLQEKASRYIDGNGRRLKGTIYEQNNQGVTFAHKLRDGDVSLKLSRSNIPYQGFVNQYMDLVANETERAQMIINKNWGKLKLELLSSLTHTDHSMDKLRSERSGKMPMNTLSDEFNTSAKFVFDSTIHFGFEYFQYRIEDWWSPVPGTGMGPNSFTNVTHGKRDRLATYLENTFNKGKEVEIIVGIRSDVVMMDAGKVSGYNDSFNAPIDAQYFNSQKRSKTDFNFDALLALRLNLSERSTMETGYARKTRSPNIYERYAWAGSQTPQAMDMRMVNWFGDGNGYVGDVDLRPEVAHKFSLKYIYNDKSRFIFEVSPFFNYVSNFIDANVLRSNGGINYLQFSNEDALLFGVDMNTSFNFYSSRKLGELSVSTKASYTRGHRVDRKADLYHLMPLYADFSLKHQRSVWENELSFKLVSHKKTVNKLRLEAETAGYALVDFATRFKWRQFTWELGVSNILDKDYQMPLAGVDVVNFSAASKTAQFGMGRSYNTNLLIEF